MAKVKCAYCHKVLNQKEAYAVKKGKRNKYYCNYEHSIAKSPREIFYDKAFEVFGKTTNTIFFKEFDEISKIHTFEKMSSYIDDNKDKLNYFMNKDFSSEYARVRYFTAIFKNNLADYTIRKQEPIIKKEVSIDIDIHHSNYKKKNTRKGINDILDEIL